MDESDPLGVFLVKSGSKGDRLLFRYPYYEAITNENTGNKKFSVLKDRRDELCSPEQIQQNVDEPGLFNFDDKVLSNLFAVTQELCGQQFELKIENVRFVGHPTYLPHASSRELSTLTMFHIVFALKASASHSVVNSYHDFSKRLSVAVHHEERRCNFLTSQVKIMQTAHDEVASLPEGHEASPFQLIVNKSKLAANLRKVFEDLKNTGSVQLKVNDWIEVSFCLPVKVHHLYDERLDIGPESIHQSLTALRPYHGMLLLVNTNELLSSLPEDTSPAMIRLIKVTSPLKNLQQLAADADIILPYVFKLVGHLVFWCKAIIIYPLCDSNVYVVSPNAITNKDSPLVDLFSDRFPNMNLLVVLSQFSMPTSLSNLASPMNLPYQQTQQVQTVIWMLQHRLLVQLHTYVTLLHTELSSSNDESADSIETENSSDQSKTSSDDEDVSLREHDYSNLTELSKLERKRILKEAASVNADDLKNFLRLRPYFNGKHHLEEIMYCENIRRSQLLKLIEKFRKTLITFDVEDAAVAAFHNFS